MLSAGVALLCRARPENSDTGWLLGVFLLASSLASSISASVWGWMADESSRRVMIRGAIVASGACLTVGLTALFAGEATSSIWFYPAGFFVLSIAHAGFDWDVKRIWSIWQAATNAPTIPP